MKRRMAFALVIVMGLMLLVLPALADNDKTVITIWSKDRHDADYVQARIDAYNETNADHIEVQYSIYSDNYLQAIDMAVQSGSVPDIVVFQDQAFNKYCGRGQWADLYPMMDDEMKEYFSSVIFKGYNEIDGKLYFIPTTATTCRLFYNKEIFQRCGLPGAPETLEQMVEYAEKITRELSGEGIYGFAQNMKSAATALNRSLMIGMQRESGLVYGFDFQKGEYNFMPYAESLRLWTKLLSEDCAFPGCESMDIDPLRLQFASGKIGMYFSYIHAEPGVYANQFPMDTEAWGVAPIPTVGGREAGKQYCSGTSAYMLNANSEHLEEAFKVYKTIFTDEDFLIGYYEGGFGVTLLPSIREKASPSADFATKEWLRIGDTDAILPVPPHFRNSAAVAIEGEDMWKTFEFIYYGGADVESTLQDLTNRYNAAYRAGIEAGIGEDCAIENYDPMNPF